MSDWHSWFHLNIYSFKYLNTKLIKVHLGGPADQRSMRIGGYRLCHQFDLVEHEEHKKILFVFVSFRIPIAKIKILSLLWFCRSFCDKKKPLGVVIWNFQNWFFVPVTARGRLFFTFISRSCFNKTQPDGIPFSWTVLPLTADISAISFIIIPYSYIFIIHKINFVSNFKFS